MDERAESVKITLAELYNAVWAGLFSYRRVTLT